MKKIVAIFLVMLLLSACSVRHEISGNYQLSEPVVRTYTVKDFCHFESMASNFNQTIYVDRFTGCLYISYGSGMVAIMEPDGTCLTYDEWKRRFQ